MCVDADNVADMTALVDLAHTYGASNVHYLWYFVRGRGEASYFAPPALIFPHLIKAAERAAQLGITLDNLESLRSQVFAPSGTIHDGPGSGWNSLAIGPDGRIYPSPALVGLPDLATPIPASLAQAWRESPVLEKIRQASAASLESPFRFLLGGGDLDHSYIHANRFLGADPYLPLYEQAGSLAHCPGSTVLRQLSEKPGLLLKMGEVLQTCGSNNGVALTHHNCLLAAAQPGSIDTIKAFYQDAALTEKTDILNPIGYPEEYHRPYPAGHTVSGLRLRQPGFGGGSLAGRTGFGFGLRFGYRMFYCGAFSGTAWPGVWGRHARSHAFPGPGRCRRGGGQPGV